MKVPARVSNSLARSLRRSQFPRAATIPVSVTSRQPLLELRSFGFTSRHQHSIRPFASTASSSHSSRLSKNKMANIKSIVTPEILLGVRDVWFEHLSGPEAFILPSFDEVKRWFFGGEAFDKLCTERFAPTLEALRTSNITSGKDIIKALQPSDACDWLSLILLLDQIPRNCYRGESAGIVFKYFDPLAREISLAAIERGIPDEQPEIRWRFMYRNWFYLPLMHSEDLATHDIAMRKYGQLLEDIERMILDKDGSAVKGDEYYTKAHQVVQDRPDAAREYGQLNLGFAKKHWDIVQRFGRYPHRNKAMGRESTAEEDEYLENGGETFGN